MTATMRISPCAYGPRGPSVCLHVRRQSPLGALSSAEEAWLYQPVCKGQVASLPPRPGPGCTGP